MLAHLRRIAPTTALSLRFAALIVASAALLLPVACQGELSGGVSQGCPDSCNQPPAASCADGKTLQTFAAQGSCVAGRCSYAPQTRACKTSCENGACVGEDPCAGVVCNTPPAATCADANNLQAYDVGYCEAGTCKYTSKTIPCTEGCANDQCTNQPCVGVVCASPPAATCKDANTLTTHDAAGSCSGGQCSYTSTDTPCPSGCENGQCKGDPCAGINCNAPPSPTCANANTQRTYASPGTCSGGQCTYAPQNKTCPQGCAAGQCQSDPCSGVTCNNPPSPSCSGNKLRTYQGSGTCSSGQCNYTFNEQTCASGCANGACITASGTLHVDDDAGAGGDGSAQNPFNSVSAAISAASAGTLIKVAAGSYSPITINKQLILQGGFAGNGSWTNRNASSNVTTISGGSNAVIRLNGAGASVIDGFRITGGNGVANNPGRFGGGIYIDGGSPTISNCTIENNGSFGSEESRGGGIYSRQANTKILDNTIRGNRSGRGGAIAVDGGTVEIRGNLIENNSGNSDHGGGLELQGQLTITDNTVRGNEIGRSLGYGWGGGIDIFNKGTNATLRRNVVTNNYAPTIGSGEFVDDGATATIENELIYDNQCAQTGGAGLYVDGDGGTGSTVTIRFSTIAQHSCGGSGNAIFIEQNSNVTAENCIFWGNGDDFDVSNNSSLTVRYTNSQESRSGSGNISSNPRFVNASGGDFHLQSTAGHYNGSGWTSDSASSPSIDTASPSAGFGQEPSPNGSRANMGRYGNTNEASKTP